MKRRIRITPISNLALWIIKIGMPIIALVFFYILYRLQSVNADQMAWEYVRILSMIEYGMMSFTIVFCGAILADFAEKRKYKFNFLSDRFFEILYRNGIKQRNNIKRRKTYS